MRSLLFLSLCGHAGAQDIFLASQSATVRVESAASLPGGWTSLGASPEGRGIELLFAVKQQRTAELQSELLAVSDPKSPRYGQHLSGSEVHDLVAPKRDDIAAVLAFLKGHGVEGSLASPNGDMIRAEVPIGLAQTMLDTRYEALNHPGSNATIHRALSGYSLPREVAEAVDFVAPTVHVAAVREPLRFQAPASQTNNVPTTLRQLYSMQDETGAEVVGKAAKNKMAVTAFLKQTYSQSALEEYWTKYCDGISCGAGEPKLVGDATTGSPGIESMLDIQTVTGMIGGVEAEFWGYGGTSPDNPENEPFMKWLAAVASTSDEDLPPLFSTSYGEDEGSWSPEAAARLNVEFMKAGARGVSLLYASGDEGANCVGGKFVPETPGSSPWVTAVGGTQPSTGWPSPGAEKAVGLSSGGFSDYFAMPDYQKAAVAAYLAKSGLPSVSECGVNTSGRAYPDVSAQAVNFCVPPFGCGVAGTSAATPTVAGIVAALNDARLAAGKAPLGFLNPLLYSLADQDVYQDVTEGSSTGCAGAAGWPATEGWDAVTGLGTLNYAKLVKAVLSLP